MLAFYAGTHVTASGQSAQQQEMAQWRFHVAEAERAQLWAGYYESLASGMVGANENHLLAERWRSYARNQQQWASHFQFSARSFSGIRDSGAASAGTRNNERALIPVARPPVVLKNGQAYGLSELPAAVHKALEAGNSLQNKPYIWGGGHRYLEDQGYDCSSAISYVLVRAGLLNRILNTTHLTTYGQLGAGRFVTIWVKPGSHTFMTICGLRLDTTGGVVAEGPRWRTSARSYAGFVPRHPPGL